MGLSGSRAGLVPTGAPADAPHVLAAYRAGARACGSRRKQGVDLGAYTTEASADDGADLALHWPDPRVRGKLGLAPGPVDLRRHPGLVERAVLGAMDAVMDCASSVSKEHLTRVPG